MSAILLVACAGALAFLLLWACAWLLHPIARRSCSHRHGGTARRVSASPQPKPEWVRKKVIYLAAHLRGCRAVALAFNRWHGTRITIGKTFAWEVMREHAREIAALRREVKRRAPADVAVGHLWALDLTYFPVRDRAPTIVLCVIDAGSRLMLRLQALPRKCAFTVLGHLFLTIAEHGLPACIRTDNEAMFTSRLWRIAMQALSITHRRGPPGQPWRNGRIERLFCTLKDAIGRRCGRGAQLLQWRLDEFAAFYNCARPHQALGGWTPMEAWAGKKAGASGRDLVRRWLQWELRRPPPS